MAIEAGGASFSRHEIHGIEREAFIGRKERKPRFETNV